MGIVQQFSIIIFLLKYSLLYNSLQLSMFVTQELGAGFLY